MGSLPFPRRALGPGIALHRPLLDLPKARLIATLADRQIGFVSDPSNADQRFERARVRGAARALDALGLTPKALALSARRLRRAREALDHAAESFLDGSSETSEAGYATVDQDALLAAPQEIALRALSRLIASVGGGEEPLQLSKLESVARFARDASRQDAHARPLPDRASVRPARHLPRDEGKRSPCDRASPGQAGAVGQSFQDRAWQLRHRAPVTVQALGEKGLRDLRDRFPLALAAACRADAACLLQRRGLDRLAGILDSWASFAPAPDLACRASFVSAESAGAAERRCREPLRKHAPLCVSFTWQKAAGSYVNRLSRPNARQCGGEASTPRGPRARTSRQVSS